MDAFYHTLSHPYPKSVNDVDNVMVETQWALRALTEYKRQLASHRNTLLPVARLPPEILSSVFHYCVPVDANQPAWSTAARMPFSQACRAWRDVALSNQLLWSTPDFSRPRYAMEMLRRAGDSPLYIDFCADRIPDRHREQGTAALRMALDGLDRIRSFIFRGPNRTMEAMLPLLRHPAPQLEHLVLESEEIGLYVLDATFLTGSAPCLHTLDLCRYGLEWKSPLFADLTDLSLAYEYSPLRVCLADLLATLAHTPSLRNFHLNHAYNLLSFTLPLPVDRGPIHLPHMDVIHLTDDLVCSTILLQHLRLPSAVSIELVAHQPKGGPPTVSADALLTVFTFMEAFPSVRSGPPIKSMTIGTNADGWLHVTVSTGRDGADPLTLQAQLDAWPERPNVADAFALAFGHLPLHAVEYLFVRVHDGPADLLAVWAAALAALPALRALRVEGPEVLWPFVAALEDAHRHAAEPPLPALRRLDIRRTELDNTRSLFSGGSQWPQALYWALADVLAVRAAAVGMLPELVLDGCLYRRENDVRHALEGVTSDLYLNYGAEDAQYWDLREAETSQHSSDGDDDASEEA